MIRTTYRTLYTLSVGVHVTADTDKYLED